MAIRVRRGNQADFDSNKLVAGELGLVLDRGEVYFCYSPGNTKKLMTAEDLQNLLSASPEAYIALQQLIADLTTDPNELANILSNISDLQSGKLDKAEKGVSLATLIDGKVPSEQLPPISSTADAITYDNALSGLNATNAQEAIDENSSQLAEKAKKIDFFINVKSLGAKGDWNGITGTDNTDMFINAITSAITLGATLYIPSGTYYLGSWVQYIVNSPLKICGTGELVGTGGSFLSVNHDFEMSGIGFENWHDVVLCTGEVEYHDILRVKKCKANNINRFVGTSNKPEQPLSGYRLIDISNNKITNSKQKAAIIINSPKFESLYINENFIDGATEQAIRVGDNTDIYFKTRKCVFVKDNIINNLKGVDGGETKQILIYADQVEISGNQLENVIGGTTGQNEGIYTKARYCKIEKNVLKNVASASGEGAIVTKGAMYDDYIASPSGDNVYGYNTIIKDNIIINTRAGVNIRAIDTMTSNLLISGNLTEGSMYEDVRITGVSKHISIIGNQFMSVSTHGIRSAASIERLIISNNMINSNSFACISLTGDSAKWVTITGNQLIGLAKITRTLDFTASILENVVVNGNLLNNATRGIVFSSTGTKKNVLYTNNMIIGIGLERVPTIDEANNIFEYNNIGTN